MHSLNWSYIAGFFDGEGSIMCHERRQQNSNYLRRVTRVRISQNNKKVLDEICEFMETNGVYATVEKHGTSMVAWNLETRTARDTYLVLLNLRDHVRVKHDKVEGAIAYLESLIEAAENGFLTRRAAFVYNELSELRKVV